MSELDSTGAFPPRDGDRDRNRELERERERQRERERDRQRYAGGDSGFTSDRAELAIAFGVLAFMTALGAWLMQPEGTDDFLPTAGTSAVAASTAVSLGGERSASAEPSWVTDPRDRSVAAPVVEPVPEPQLAEEVEEIVPVMAEPVEEIVAEPPVLDVTEEIQPEVVIEEQVEEVIFEPAPAPVVEPEPAVEPETEAQLLRRAMENVQFITGSAVLTEPSRAVLDDIVALMKSRPNTGLRIVGHTDSMGADDDNVKLSFARAEACRDYLLARGLEVDRVNAAGFGERRPIATNDTAEGQRQNRRVEFELVPGGQ